MSIVLISIILSLGGVASSNSPIGNSFYVPNVGILDEELDGGFQIFKDKPTKCIHSEPDVEITHGGYTFYENTNSFYHSTAIDASLSLKLAVDFTLGVTLGYVSKSISGSSNKVRGISYGIYSQISKGYIDKNCLVSEALSIEMVNAFEKLPATIARPWLDSEWELYKLFLEKFNTHIVTEVKYGSAIYQHCFSEASNSYTSKQYGIKVCIDFAHGLPIVDVGLNICLGVTNEDVASVASLSTSSRLVLRGGTVETRSALYVNHTNKLIMKFLEEANSTHSPIQYKFISIWELLQLKYTDTEHFAKAINLQAFYEGYLNFGCKYLVSNTNVELQKFNHSDLNTPAYPVYDCIIAPNGCKVTADCHYKVPLSCECRGNSCVSYKTVTSSTDVQRKVPYIFTESGNSGQGCVFEGLSCHCSPNTVWEKIWTQDESDSCLISSKIIW